MALHVFLLFSLLGCAPGTMLEVEVNFKSRDICGRIKREHRRACSAGGIGDLSHSLLRESRTTTSGGTHEWTPRLPGRSAESIDGDRLRQEHGLYAGGDQAAAPRLSGKYTCLRALEE